VSGFRTLEKFRLCQFPSFALSRSSARFEPIFDHDRKSKASGVLRARMVAGARASMCKSVSGEIRCQRFELGAHADFLPVRRRLRKLATISLYA